MDRLAWLRVILAAFLITAWLGAPLARAEEASPEADTGYAHPEWLADAAWLRDRLNDPILKIIALTPAGEFEAGHIPGAAQIDWPALEIVETGEPSVERWRSDVERLLTDLGVRRDQTVVVYDGGTLYAVRLWWILHQLGHADVRILNGGLPAWVEAGGELATGSAEPEPAPEPYVGEPDEAAIATLAEVEAALDDPDVVLVDARSPEEYAAGHIPGAINVEFARNAEADQPRYWKSSAELREMYASLGITPEKRVIPYCTSGVRSAATYFTLRLIGYERVELFTGSWQEWSSHPELPSRTGDAP